MPSSQLLAVSVGRPRDLEWRGTTIRTGIFKSPVEGPVEVTPTGLAGDGQADLRVHGGIDKAIYAFDEAAAQHWREELGRRELGAGAFGENLTLRGWPETRTRIGDVIRIGTSVFEVSQPRQPCSKLGLRFDDPSFPKRFLESGRVGFYLRVLEVGEIEAGDAVAVLHSDEDGMSISELVSIWLDQRAPRADLERAVALRALADAWRDRLSARLARSAAI